MSRKYSKEHEWVELKGNIATIGLSDHAAKELGDITFVEQPAIDDEFAIGDVLTVVESVKAATDVFAPISGVVVEVNETLEDEPNIVNESAEDDGWICKLEAGETITKEFEALMTEEEYSSFLNNL